MSLAYMEIISRGFMRFADQNFQTGDKNSDAIHFLILEYLELSFYAL